MTPWFFPFHQLVKCAQKDSTREQVTKSCFRVCVSVQKWHCSLEIREYLDNVALVLPMWFPNTPCSYCNLQVFDGGFMWRGHTTRARTCVCGSWPPNTPRILSAWCQGRSWYKVSYAIYNSFVSGSYIPCEVLWLLCNWYSSKVLCRSLLANCYSCWISRGFCFWGAIHVLPAFCGCVWRHSLLPYERVANEWKGRGEEKRGGRSPLWTAVCYFQITDDYNAFEFNSNSAVSLRHVHILIWRYKTRFQAKLSIHAGVLYFAWNTFLAKWCFCASLLRRQSHVTMASRPSSSSRTEEDFLANIALGQTTTSPEFCGFKRSATPIFWICFDFTNFCWL